MIQDRILVCTLLIAFTQLSESANLTSRNVKTPVLFSIDQAENAIADFDKDHKISLEIIGESLCPDTTRFLYRQLLPVWKEFGSSGILNITYHPFGIPTKTVCTPTDNSDLFCRCQHGPLECVMNQLQACVISELPDFRDHLETVICIQGKRDVRLAIEQCVIGNDGKVTIDPLRLEQCATGSEGRRLMAEHGIKQSQIAKQTNWVPWIIVNGRRERAAEYHLRYLLCNKFSELGAKICN